MQTDLQASLWILAHKFVRDYEFSVYHVERSGQQDQRGQSAIHLILEQKRRALYLRLVPIDNYWAQVVERDVTESKHRFAQLTRRIKPQLDVLNVYVLPEPPSDEMVERAAKASVTSRRNPFEMKVLFLDLQHKTWQGSLHTIKNWGIDPSELERSLTVLSTEFDSERLRQEIRELERERERAVLSVFRYGKPLFTFAFLFVNAIIYMLVLMDGGVQNLDTLLRYGAKSNGLIIEGEWWRLITPVFLHLGSWHFMFNMIALYFLGTAVERIYGSTRFSLIYILAGLSGSVASFAFTDNLSAGASGAIFGCFGALIVFGQHYPKLFFRTMGRDILFFLGLNLALGFIVPNIDNYGHLGGLFGGYLAAAFVSLPQKKSRFFWRAGAGIALAAVLIMTTLYGYAEGDESTSYLAWKGQQYIQEEELEDALPIYEHLIQIEPENAFHHFHLGYVYSKMGRLNEAEMSWQTAIKLEPNMPEAHYNLAILYVSQEEMERAKDHVNRARDLDPSNEDIAKLWEELHR